MNNGNGHHCHRCGGLILYDGEDLYCLICGWRLSFPLGNLGYRAYYLRDAIVARLIHNGHHDMDDIQAKHCRQARLAGKNNG